MFSRRVIAAAVTFGAVKYGGAEEETTTCKFTADIGSGELQCEVPGARKACCDMQLAIDDCMKQKEGVADCFQKAITDNGFDLRQMEDPKYLAEKCPVLTALQGEEAAKKWCKVEKKVDVKEDKSLLEKTTCSLVDGPHKCEVPGVKKICCMLANAMLPCEEDPEKTAGCQAAEFQKLMPKLLAAGVDIEAAEDMKYWDKFCPVLAEFYPPSKEEEQKYCTSEEGKDSEKGASRLFSIKPRFSFVKPRSAAKQASVAPIVAMAGLGVACVALLVRVVTRRVGAPRGADGVELEPVMGEESLVA